MDQAPTGPLYYSLLQRVSHGPVWLPRKLRRGYKNTNVHRVLRTYRKGPRTPQEIHGIRRATLATAPLKATERQERSIRASSWEAPAWTSSCLLAQH